MTSNFLFCLGNNEKKVKGICLVFDPVFFSPECFLSEDIGPKSQLCSQMCIIFRHENRMITDGDLKAKSVCQNLNIKDLDIITIISTDFPPFVTGLETLSKEFK